MRNLFVGLFWLWVLVAVGIYAVRLWRRLTRGPELKSKHGSPGVGFDASVPIVSPTSGLAARPANTLPPPEPAPKPAPVEPRVTAHPEPDVGNGTGTRSGLFAPTTAPGTSNPASSADGRTEARSPVAELVAGIAMPCDLAPIVGSDRFLDPYHVAFSTDTEPAATVGAGVADELERLGFALQSTAENRLAATKDGRQLTVTIYPDAADVTFGDGKAYPTVPPGSVVVQFTS